MKFQGGIWVILFCKKEVRTLPKPREMCYHDNWIIIGRVRPLSRGKGDPGAAYIQKMDGSGAGGFRLHGAQRLLFKLPHGGSLSAASAAGGIHGAQ